MTKTNPYEKLIWEAIAKGLNLQPSSLRFFPVIPTLPQNNRELFSLFDVIPSSSPVFKINENIPSLSSTFGALLQSQPDSLMVETARKNFENPDYWLPDDSASELPKTPIYSPTSSEISDFVARGAAFQYSFDSAEASDPTDNPYPSFPSFVVNLPFQMFNQTAERNRFVFTLKFDRVVTSSIRAGGWFSQAVFTSAFQSGGDGWITGPGTVTWESLFGEDGILNFIFNGTVAVSGMVLQLQSFGQYDNAVLDTLNSNDGSTVWPFYLNVENLVQEYVLGEDGSITIISKVPSSEILLLAMQAARVKDLM